MLRYTEAAVVSNGADLLPPELVDAIVENLKDEVDALKTCSLLSKTWMACARPRIFREAHLGTKDDGERWSKLIRSCPAIASHYLREVDFSPPEGPITEQCLPLLAQMPRVTRLGWYMDTTTQTTVDLSVQRFTSYFPAVNDLFLVGGFSSLVEVAKFLTQFNGIRTLELQEVEYHGPDIDIPDELVFNSTSLEKLVLGCAAGDYMKLAEWLVPSGRPCGLRSLDVGGDTLQAHAISSILECCANTLEELTLQVPPPSDLLYISAPKVPMPLPKLRKLEFGTIWESEDEDGEYPPIYWVASFIHSLPVMESVSVVHFEFGDKNPHPDSMEGIFENMPWESIVEVTLKPTFPQLKTIEIVVHTEGFIPPELRTWAFRRLADRMRKVGIHLRLKWDDKCRDLSLKQIVKLLAIYRGEEPPHFSDDSDGDWTDEGEELTTDDEEGISADEDENGDKEQLSTA